MRFWSTAGNFKRDSNRSRSLLLGCVFWAVAGTRLLAVNGELEIRIVDDATGEPIAAQVQLRDRRGRIRPIRKTATWNHEYVVDGKAILSLNPGTYTFRVRRGPEYRDLDGHFLIERAATDNKTIRMSRFVDLAKLGWWSADLALSHAARDVDGWMRSADLHVGSVQGFSFDGSWTTKNTFSPTWTQNGSHWHAMSAGRDSVEGRVLALNLPHRLPENEPAVPTRATSRRGSNLRAVSLPTVGMSTEFLRAARRFPQSHLCVVQANAWDLPLWLANGYVDSFMLLGPQLRQDGKKTKDPPGYPRDVTFFPEPHGWARWSQAIYYHILNCGFRIPPVAGSGSGFGPNSVGYARTYVRLEDRDEQGHSTDGELQTRSDIDRWWDALRRGHVMVTNGPLLIPKANGRAPGHVFSGVTGETVVLTTSLTLHTREKIEYLEIVKNGRVLNDVMLSELIDHQGVLPDIEFTKSGWFLIRAVTKSSTYHAVSTGPFYVEFDGQPSVRRESVEFFRKWLDQRRSALAEFDEADNPQVQDLRTAHEFWDELLERAPSAR